MLCFQNWKKKNSLAVLVILWLGFRKTNPSIFSSVFFIAGSIVNIIWSNVVFIKRNTSLLFIYRCTNVWLQWQRIKVLYNNSNLIYVKKVSEKDVTSMFLYYFVQKKNVFGSWWITKHFLALTSSWTDNLSAKYGSNSFNTKLISVYTKEIFTIFVLHLSSAE